MAIEITGVALSEQRNLTVMIGRLKQSIKSLNEASVAYRVYIESDGLGARDASLCKVLGEDGKKIADISYNGRVWSVS